MKKRIFLITAPLLMMMSVSYATSFSVTNNSSMQGIYVEYTNGSGPQIANCTAVTGASGCCAFLPLTQTTANFTLSGNLSFNISVGFCGSTRGKSSSQAEFNINQPDPNPPHWKCGGLLQCDVVDVSNVGGLLPVAVNITPLNAPAINSGDSSNCCGVFTEQNKHACSTAPLPSCVANGCPGGVATNAQNYCNNTYTPQSSYTITFS
ncbi:MAG: hypothetical protein A3E82_03455 [Gammaproteobacteria bacterium RIFCSPHIGHO2_12_FULL_38_11]|nr:MAG: hypothetical protein A3E82_03455 [Gammaproteobacteria bacterium RIFCSPHIGHO2_12_FULL_38_11]